MTDAIRPEPKRRRLKGAKLAELRTLMKRLEGVQVARNRAREDVLDARDLFPDQPNWKTGHVYDAGIKIADREIIGRLDPSEVAADRKFMREMEEIDLEIGDLLWLCADRLGCMPKDIDVTSGEIKGGLVEGIDPDEPQDEPAEDAGDELPDAPAEPAVEGEGPLPFPTKSA